MLQAKVDKDIRKNILDARRMIEEAEKADCNEAETRRRLERMFETLMGYEAFEHLSRERAVRGAGETEHVDFTIQLERGEDASPEIMVELKRVCVDLAPKHLRQVSSYAINAGCEWIILTNAKEWRLYHISFGQPPVTKLIYSWNLLTDDVSILAQRFDQISYRSLKRGALTELWRRTNVLHPSSLLQAILSENSMGVLRREIRRKTGVLLATEDVVSGIRRMLNESALAELETIRICLPDRKTLRRRRQPRGGGLEVVASKVEASGSPQNAIVDNRLSGTSLNAEASASDSLDRNEQRMAPPIVEREEEERVPATPY